MDTNNTQSIREAVNSAIHETTLRCCQILKKYFSIETSVGYTSSPTSGNVYYVEFTSISDCDKRLNLSCGEGGRIENRDPKIISRLLISLVEALDVTKLFLELVDDATSAGIYFEHCDIQKSIFQDFGEAPTITFIDSGLRETNIFECTDAELEKFRNTVYNRASYKALAEHCALFSEYGIALFFDREEETYHFSFYPSITNDATARLHAAKIDEIREHDSGPLVGKLWFDVPRPFAQDKAGLDFIKGLVKDMVDFINVPVSKT